MQQILFKLLSKKSNHVSLNHSQLFKQSDIPEDATVVPSVWAMWSKSDLTMNNITKCKAYLKQENGVNYNETMHLTSCGLQFDS